MSEQLTTESVWDEIERNNFAVLGIGVSLSAMRHPDRARARVPVESD